jgi:2-succinyl-5-enolpyruvyl-6-hydroxy-3-cyclohexene-1-carboxylate synthase
MTKPMIKPDSLQHQNTTYTYVNAFVDELARAGVRNVVICPGSRSTPLAMIFTEQHTIKMWMHLDERSAAFFALGLAKASRQPVALVCTSGTATANFLPAVVEAYYACVPLLVLTADRPPELRNIGAPQTIDQDHLYGSHAKWFVEMALPEATPTALRYVRATADRAVAEAVAAPAGPVHLNFPFREPLVPLPAESPVADVQRADKPYTQVTPGLRRADASELEVLADQLANVERGLIVCGPLDDQGFPAAVTRLAQALGYPILADPLSQVRCGPHVRDQVIAAYDALLRDAGFAAEAVPQVVLRFGAVPTSKPLVQYLEAHADCPQILFDGGGRWNDPALIASRVIYVDARSLCDDLYAKVVRKSKSSGAWLAHWLEAERRTQLAVISQLAGYSELFEGSVFTELAAVLPDDATVFASSSMPVRDMDTFMPGSGKAIRFMANRGANGIDGVVSSALGASAASTHPLALVIGDVAFYHDMNGLLAAKLHQLNATVVLINNNGGGIFSFLPQADYPEHFEQLYGTPHGLDFRHAAELYGAHYTVAADWPAFREAVTRSITTGRLNIVEVQTNRERNVILHRSVWKAVSEALAKGNA